MSVFPTFSHSDLRRLLIAQCPADFADWLDFVAIGALLAFVWQAPPFVFALLAVAMGLPYLIVGPLAGAVVDRLPIRSVLLGSNIGRALATAMFAFAPGWETLLVLVALRNSVDAFFTPAKQAAIQALTDPSERNSANGISMAINQSSKVIAPALGGGLLAIFAPQPVFAVNACVSLGAAYLIWRMDPIDRPTDNSDQDQISILRQLRDAARLVRSSAVLKLAMGLMVASFFGMFFYDTLIAPMAAGLGYSQTDLGLSLAVIGGGGLIGALSVTALGAKAKPFLLIGVASIVSGSLVICLGGAEVIGLPTSRVVLGPVLFVVGVAGGLAFVPFRTLLQDHTPAHQMGQITAFSEALNTLALLTAPFAGAAIASVTSLGVAFMIGGGVTVVVAVFALANWRRA
mgnify:CR=1 FL=1